MDPLSTIAGAIGIVDVCLRFGKTLVKLCDDYRGAETEIAETLLKLKVLWVRAEIQMELLKRLWSSLSAELQQTQLLLLNQLELKLQQAVKVLDALIGDSKGRPSTFLMILRKGGSIRRAKFALTTSASLRQTVADFEDWYSLCFDPSWHLIAKVESQEIDRQLKSENIAEQAPVQSLLALRKSAHDLATASNLPTREISSRDFLGPRSSIAHCSAAVAQFLDNTKLAIVDAMVVSPFAEITATTRDVKALARALSRMDPLAFGLLRCCGVVNKSHVTDGQLDIAFDLAFEIPRGFQSPRGLRDLLKHDLPSLNVRLEISRRLATSVFYLHTTGFVHKNIRPETILLFDQDGASKMPCLVGFENFRKTDTGTSLIGDDLMEHDMYRHPSRQGNDPAREYIMQHDVYSLGVCLLEIGLWETFVIQTNSEGGFLPSTVVSLDGLFDSNDARERGFDLKKKYISLAEDRLPQAAGDTFSSVVGSCLTCLDEPKSWEQPLPHDSDGVSVGISYIENVILQLQQIVL